LRECGIQRQTNAPYTPQQNGVAKRANKTIMECARNMIRARGLDLEFWAKAMNYWKQLENKQEMKASRFVKWNNCIN
jgi:hypothetical protein